MTLRGEQNDTVSNERPLPSKAYRTHLPLESQVTAAPLFHFPTHGACVAGSASTSAGTGLDVAISAALLAKSTPMLS